MIDFTRAEGAVEKVKTRLLVDGRSLSERSRQVALQCPWVRMVLGTENIEDGEKSTHLNLGGRDRYRVDLWEEFTPGTENVLFLFQENLGITESVTDEVVLQRLIVSTEKLGIDKAEKRDVLWVILSPEFLSLPKSMDFLGHLFKE